MERGVWGVGGSCRRPRIGCCFCVHYVSAFAVAVGCTAGVGLPPVLVAASPATGGVLRLQPHFDLIPAFCPGHHGPWL